MSNNLNPQFNIQNLQAAVRLAQANETSWDRENTSRWGIHGADKPPWNRLLGPIHPRGPVSGTIQVAGQTLLSWGEPNRADLTFSIAKTYLALLAGVAFDQGLLTDLQEPVAAKIHGIGFESEHNRTITWLELLQQTSEWQGECFGISDQVDHFRQLPYQPARPDMKSSKGDARILQPPGTYWEYNDVRINQLSLALLHLFGQALPDVFRRTIARSCGLSNDWQWQGYENSWVNIKGGLVQSVPGGTHWGGGISIGSIDQAKIGQMLANGGRVGTKQVLSSTWIQTMLEPCSIAPWYGTLVWLNRSRSIFPSAPSSSYFLIGAGANIVWIDPVLKLVAVVRWIESAKFDSFCAAVMNS
jgi:CubicO group peptidase (beta-lactamase class C family)